MDDVMSHVTDVIDYISFHWIWTSFENNSIIFQNVFLNLGIFVHLISTMTQLSKAEKLKGTTNSKN